VTESGRVNELQDLMLRRLAELGDPGQPLSLRRAAEKTRGLVSYEILRQIARGEHSGNIADRSAEGIALAIGVPVEQVYQAAKVPRPSGRWQWPARFDRLDLSQRRVVEDVAAGFLDSYEKGLRDAR
jgi:hypothetical protein